MARHPEWFERIDSIIAVTSEAKVDWLGRREMQSLFNCSERDSIRLLHKFGGVERNNALSLSRTGLLAQLDAIRAGEPYAAFSCQRQQVARRLSTARVEAEARQFRVEAAVQRDVGPELNSLPPTITWRRFGGDGPGRFEILYSDGADLMAQIAEFLAAAGVNREEFLGATEPPDASL
jgi:hypothetical protein